MSDRVLSFRENHGLGPILFKWQKGRTGYLIATAGVDCSVAIFNRQGVLQERIILSGPCVDLDWDSEGDLLAVVVQNSSQLLLWDANTRKRQHIDIGLRDSPTVLVWSATKQVLCVATAKGNLSIYNNHTQRRTPILGKHSRRITGGCWSKTNSLALISDDKSLSISNEDGDSLRIVQLSDTPSDIRFAKMLGGGPRDAREENILSVILGGRVLFLYNLAEPDAPIELGFQQHYGDLERHLWFGEGLIMLAFSQGFIVTISTKPRELGQELRQLRVHSGCLVDFDLNEDTAMIATCGQDTVKLHPLEWSDPTGGNVRTLTGNEEISSLRLSNDGQLLAIATNQGGFCIFVTQLSVLYAVDEPKIAVLTNLSEVSVYNFDPDTKGYRQQLNRPSTVALELEPDFIGIGPAHLACGLNNHVVFYELDRDGQALQLDTREFHAQVKGVQLTDKLCAVLCGGQVVLQNIGVQSEGRREPQIFPDSVPGLAHTVISHHQLTNHFLVFSTDLGHIIHFDLRSWTVVLQYRNDVGIKSLHADKNGVRVIMLDDHGKAAMYLAAPFSGDSILPIPGASAGQFTGFLWDSHDSDLFIGYSKTMCHIFTFVRHSLEGAKVLRVAEMRLLSGVPMLLSRGEMVVISDAERLTTLQLVTHGRQENKVRRLEVLRKMHKLEAAWDLCMSLNDRKEFESLYEVAVETLNIRLALRIQRHLGNVAQVKFLEEIQDYDDVRLLQASCAILLNKTEVAQQILLKSSTTMNHHEALDMCRDLLMWEQALTMAQQIAPQEVFAISLEYAQQLEYSENFREALVQYQKALSYKRGNQAANVARNHDQLAMSGFARTSIRCGDFETGLKVARELRDPILLSECGHLLVEGKQLQEAVKLFEMAGQNEDACRLYIEMRAWRQVEKLLPSIQSPQLHLDYAKASEQENRLEEALRHYKFANDIDNVVRLHLMLNDAHSAQEAILEMPSVTGSKLLAAFYQKMGDYEEAIKFLVQCDAVDEAFQLAKIHKKLPFYGEQLEKADGVKAKDFRDLAEIFEVEKYTLLAGKYFFLARDFHKALKFLLKASAFDADDKNVSLSLAIDCVAMADDADGQLTKQLIEFLLGETDGAPKDPRFLFRLYMAKKEFKDAAKIAVVIAEQEQQLGNYRSAHDLLFQMSVELRQNELQVAAELRDTLVLLHRYIVARLHVKLGNHDLAARLLTVVAGSVSKFPSHTVPILTSTVIECQRAGLRQAAFKYASQLMRPDLRVEIPQKYSKKIEAIVRKNPSRATGGGEEESVAVLRSDCPYCHTTLDALELNCYQCKETIPMCIASGLHLPEGGVATCGKCYSPCIKEIMVPLLELTQACPMCGDSLEANQLMDVVDVHELTARGV